MASDRTGTHPQGVLVRPAPDFFDDSLCTGGSNYLTDPPVGNTFASISLYNDTPIGQVLKVYGIASGNDNVGGSFAYPLQGPPLGTFQGQCRNIRFDLGAPPGQIWMRLDTTADPTDLYPLPLPVAPTILAVATVGGSTILSPFPMFIIPAGYSLVVANTSNASQVFAAFWYQVANE